MSGTCNFSHANTMSPSTQQTSGGQSELVLTLPFDPSLVKLDIGAAVLSRTGERWDWFAKGQTLCPGLGTLVYFPAEVRRLIWKLLFECPATLSADGLWEYDHTCGPIFDLNAYYFGFGRRGLAGYDGLQGLRSVSSMVKAESDEAFLTCRTFRFNQPENLAGFFDQLKAVSTQQLKSLEIGICTLYYMEPWMDPMTRLPPGLHEVKIRIYPVLFGWYDTARGQDSLVQLGKIVEKVVQSCPDAKISIASTKDEPLSPKCREAADAILNRLQHQRLSQK